jgi:hypothetical protein
LARRRPGNRRSDVSIICVVCLDDPSRLFAFRQRRLRVRPVEESVRRDDTGLVVETARRGWPAGTPPDHSPGAAMTRNRLGEAPAFGGACRQRRARS